MSETPPPTRCPFVAASEPAASAPTAESAPTRSTAPVRWALAGLGFACVGLGALGTVVPGLPTTIFLIIASWAFTRSCPWLDERMRASRIFTPYVRFLDPDAPMPARTRAIVLGLLWLFAGGSAVGLALGGHHLAAGLTAAAALGGTVMILRWRREAAAG